METGDAARVREESQTSNAVASLQHHAAQAGVVSPKGGGGVVSPKGGGRTSPAAADVVAPFPPRLAHPPGSLYNSRGEAESAPTEATQAPTGPSKSRGERMSLPPIKRLGTSGPSASGLGMTGLGASGLSASSAGAPVRGTGLEGARSPAAGSSGRALGVSSGSARSLALSASDDERRGAPVALPAALTPEDIASPAGVISAGGGSHILPDGGSEILTAKGERIRLPSVGLQLKDAHAVAREQARASQDGGSWNGEGAGVVRGIPASVSGAGA